MGSVAHVGDEKKQLVCDVHTFVTTHNYTLKYRATLWPQHGILDLTVVLYKPLDFIK